MHLDKEKKSYFNVMLTKPQQSGRKLQCHCCPMGYSTWGPNGQALILMPSSPDATFLERVRGFSLAEAHPV